jgi:hypothetical protein
LKSYFYHLFYLISFLIPITPPLPFCLLLYYFIYCFLKIISFYFLLNLLTINFNEFYFILEFLAFLFFALNLNFIQILFHFLINKLILLIDFIQNNLVLPLKLISLLLRLFLIFWLFWNSYFSPVFFFSFIF